MGVRDGRSLTLGSGGPVLVDAAELVVAAQRLSGAGDGLDAAGGMLRAATWRAAAIADDVPEAGALFDALDALRRAAYGPAGLAQGVRDLAGRTRDAAAAYDLAETEAQARLATVVGVLGIVVGPGPLGPTVLGSMALGVAVGDLLLDEARSLARDPWGTLSPRGLGDDVARLTSVPQRIVTDGRGALALQLLAAALGSMTGASGPHLDPVRRFSAHVAGLLPARDMRLVPRVDPPDLPPPRGIGDLVDLVARTYDEDTATGEPGTPLATVTVQRLDHADGNRTWVVAVPGTRAAGLTGDVPTDNGTNLALEGGVPDVMTSAVIAAMGEAGIGAAEPVALVGHSQGGMVAANVAAATVGTYAVRLVVSAGAPDVPVAPPAGVATVTLRHREDAVTILDGKVGERGGPGALSVVRDLTATGGPARPSFSEAHAVAGYVRTGGMVDDALGDLPADDPVRGALSDVLGESPAKATTTQVTVTAAPPPAPVAPTVARPFGPSLGGSLDGPLGGSLDGPLGGSLDGPFGARPAWPPMPQVPWSSSAGSS